MPAQKPPRPPQAWHLRSQSLAADSRAALNFAAFLRKVAAMKPSSRARLAALALAIAGVVSPVSVPADGIRGTPEAVAAAERLLEQAGGAAAWRKAVFEVRERGYLSSGQMTELTITRDLARPARRFESRRPDRTVIEWISPGGGWIQRDGEKLPMSAEELAAELQGLRQEPYAIYHRLARRDPRLRAELRDGGALHFFDGDERPLCWFQLAPNGVLLGWGNYYNGAINQHWYGPVADVGDANLPRFGVAANGSFRFEYLGATLTEGPLATPE
jgi:hypothetical protein